MTEPGLIVIGSGPAGVGAAEAFRTHNSSLPIRLISADPALPYERPPLSKDFLRGETDDLALHPQSWFTERGIELERGVQLDRIDPENDVVVVGGGDRYPYTSLVVATGASPSPLPAKGGERALSLRSLADAERLRTAGSTARSAVVVGAGFIGCEAAASLARRGVKVTLVSPQDVPQEERLGRDAGRQLLRLVQEAGVHHIGGVSVKAVDDDGVELDSGAKIECDLVLAATGVAPNSAVAEAAGLAIEQSRIVVGPGMATSVPNIFAAGDVAVAYNASAGRPIMTEHWQDAADQGEIAGASAAGAEAKWDAVPGFWTTIGESDVKYHAWGDGYQSSRLLLHDDGFTVWYERDGAAVGVLTLNADVDYDLGERLIREGHAAPVPLH
jgi:NADPH-dependent 2,4-dienoyl-CoA reductase/sulfur reductase-like enzyme